MALITPSGKMNFDWSPQQESEMTRKASTGDAKESDKDILYSLAKKVVESQFEDVEEVDSLEENIDSTDINELSDESKEGSKEDIQEAVSDLVDKAEKADEVVEKVQDAVQKVEEAVQDVKDAVVENCDEIDEIESKGDEVEEVEIEITDDEPEEVAIEITDDEPEETDEAGGEDIIQRSDEDEDVLAGVKAELKKESASDEFVKTSKISPETRKKIIDFWQKDLGYPADYVKLMATNFES